MEVMGPQICSFLSNGWRGKVICFLQQSGVQWVIIMFMEVSEMTAKFCSGWISRKVRVTWQIVIYFAEKQVPVGTRREREQMGCAVVSLG